MPQNRKNITGESIFYGLFPCLWLYVFICLEEVESWIMPLLSGKYEVVWLIEIAAYCAVNCYALISGYVGIHGKYRYSNWVLLWLRVLFYSILITVFFKFAAPSVVGRYEWTSAIFPTSREQYWYFTAYTGLFLLIPVLNFLYRMHQENN